MKWLQYFGYIWVALCVVVILWALIKFLIKPKR